MGRVGIVGLQPDELSSVQVLLDILRHPDPVIVALAQEALDYLCLAARRSPLARLDTDSAKID